jgi:hypothetical protein
MVKFYLAIDLGGKEGGREIERERERIVNLNVFEQTKMKFIY